MSKIKVEKDQDETQTSDQLKTKDYEQELTKRHVELVKRQEWVRHKGLKVCVVFEGRDGAGKGGTIKAITERVSPRLFQVVALPAPTEREKSPIYVQRYMSHFPAAGEVYTVLRPCAHEVVGPPVVLTLRAKPRQILRKRGWRRLHALHSTKYPAFKRNRQAAAAGQ